METKTCRDCGETKVLDDFYRHKNSPDGRQIYCKPCDKQRASVNGAKLKAAVKAFRGVASQDWQDRCRAHHEKYGYGAHIDTANRRAQKAGARGLFTHQDVALLYKRQAGACACCGRMLGSHYREARAFEIDHIVPIARGGSNEPGNLQLLCTGAGSCNTSKGSKTPAEFRLHLRRRGRMQVQPTRAAEAVLRWGSPHSGVRGYASPRRAHSAPQDA